MNSGRFKVRRSTGVAWVTTVVVAIWGPRAALADSNELQTLSWRLWRHPTFQREFLGSYGMRSDVEPGITPEERQLLERAMALMAKPGGRDVARKLLERSVGAKSSAVLDFVIGNLYLQAEQLDRAAAWYRRAVAKFPAFLRAHKNLGLVHIRRGSPSDAIDPLCRAIALGAADGTTYGLLGFAYLQTDRPASAESAYRMAVLLQPQVDDWWMGLARCLFRQRKYEEAAALCEEMIRRDPKRPEYRALLASAWLGQRQFLKAAEVYEWMDMDQMATADQLFTLGDLYVNERLFDLAADAYVRAHERGGDATDARLLQAAEALGLRGAYDEADRLAARLAERDLQRLGAPAMARWYRLRARLAAARGESDAEQLRLLEQALELDPMDGEALLLLAQRYAAAGDLERAVLALERASQLDSVAAEAYLRHAQLLVRQRRYNEALPLLKRSLELRPRDDVSRYAEQVERLAKPDRRES